MNRLLKVTNISNILKLIKKTMEKTILILGATGNIGGKAAELLLIQGLSVKVCGRIPEKLESLKQKGAEVFQGDLSDSEFV